MKEKEQSRFKIIKICIIAFSIINLTALFLFHYELPNFLSFSPSKSKENITEVSSLNDSETSQDTEVTYSIQFDTESLTYNGTDKLNLLNGVSIVSTDGSTTSAEIFAHIITGDSLTHKEIIYSADMPNGQISSSRKLILENYNGPSIHLPTELPELSEKDLDNMLEYLQSDDAIFADDGFGNDITDSISMSYSIDDTNPSIVHYTFTITNLYNDTTSVSTDLVIDSDRPILVLKQKELTIPAGSRFRALDYVEKAEDAHGNSLFQRISIEGKVDNNTPGTYTLTYIAITTDGTTSVPQNLIVIVE